MPIWLHLPLTIITQVGGAIGGVLLAMGQVKDFHAWGISFPFVFLSFFILGLIVPRLVFQFLIPAICPQCGCWAFRSGSRPITYSCRSCGHIHKTSVSEGREDFSD